MLNRKPKPGTGTGQHQPDPQEPTPREPTPRQHRGKARPRMSEGIGAAGDADQQQTAEARGGPAPRSRPPAGAGAACRDGPEPGLGPPAEDGRRVSGRTKAPKTFRFRGLRLWGVVICVRWCCVSPSPLKSLQLLLQFLRPELAFLNPETPKSEYAGCATRAILCVLPEQPQQRPRRTEPCSRYL